MTFRGTRLPTTLNDRAFAQAFDLAHVMVRELDGRILFWSSTMEHLYGWSYCDAIGRISHELLKTEFPRPRPEIEGELLRSGHWEGELQHHTRDGGTITVASHWALDRDAAGQSLWVIEVNNDITALKASERERGRINAALEDTYRRLEVTVDAGRIGTWEVDLAAGTVRHSARRCEMMGLAREPLEEACQDFVARVHPDDRDKVAALCAGTVGEHDHFRGSFRFVWPGGSVRWVETRAELIRDAAGVPMRVVGASIDMTDRELREAALRHARQAAEQATQSKSRVLAAVGHDLKQPVHIIGMAVDMLRRGITAPDQRGLLGRVDRALDRLAAALDSLLEVARLEAGAVAPRIEIFPVQILLDKLEEQFGLLATSKGLSFAIESCSAEVRSDPKMLETILHNLVGNAIKYTEQGRIEVSCQRREGVLSIAIRDTGIGVPPDKIDLIFEEFQRLDSSTGKSGLGLGLAIVRHTANLLGHPLRVQSAPGQGSVFSVDIPLR